MSAPATHATEAAAASAKPSKPGGLKPYVLAVLVAVLAHFAYDVYDREFKTPPKSVYQQVAEMQALNQSTGKQLQQINSVLPGWAKK